MKAFTLAETLTVVLIIAVLASVLFPVFGRTKSNANEIVCLSNMRQIYSAVSMYDSDYGAYPPDSLVWPALKPYYPTVLACPMQRQRTDTREFDYLYFGSPPLGDAANIQSWYACHETRGPAIPIIWDMNHYGPQQGVESGTSFILLTRLDGSEQRVDGSKLASAISQNLPCNNPPSPEMNL